MEGTSTELYGVSSQNSYALNQMRESALKMSTWLKFLGVITIVGGAISIVFTLGIGIIYAWLPIWLGVLLFQAGDRAGSIRYSEDLNSLAQMMEKLKMYFVVYGVSIIVIFVFAILAAIFAASFFHDISRMFPDIMESY